MNFDEFTIEQMFESKSYKMNKAEIIAFATEFDPQYMHIDEEKAMKSRFKGIIASGLHTLNISFKLWITTGAMSDEVIAGTGVNNLRFIKPVYPEDILYSKAKVIKKKERKEDGEVTFLLSTYKNDDELVLEAEISALISK